MICTNRRKSGAEHTGVPARMLALVSVLAGSILLGRAGAAHAMLPLDHFIFYKASPGSTCVGGPTPGAPCRLSSECGGGSCTRTKTYPFAPIRLTDQLGSENYTVVSNPKLLGLPANKDGYGTADDRTHLQAYGVKPFTPVPLRLAVRVAHQSMDVRVDVLKPYFLLLPANTSLIEGVAPPQESDHQLDHFLCYKARLTKRLPNGTTLPVPRPVRVSAVDQFRTLSFDMLARKINLFCEPVAKQEDPEQPPLLLQGQEKGTPKMITPASIRNPTARLLCYKPWLLTSIPTRMHKKSIAVAEQFHSVVVRAGVSVWHFCLPSIESHCGNGLVEFPEACDGADNTACEGLSCRDDCTCTPALCGNNVREGSGEECDGSDDAACGGLPCRADCSCTPPSCGDNIVNQPNEACDGSAGGECPGQCDAHCRCPGPGCPQDVTRTIFGDEFPGCCYLDDAGNQSTCERAYAIAAAGGTTHVASCTYGSLSGTCSPCDAVSQLKGLCTNSCLCGNNVIDRGEECDGADAPTCPGACQADCRCPAPTCVQDPGRTFAGEVDSDGGCATITDQAACNGAFETDSGFARSCAYESDSERCRACVGDPGRCTNTCACGNNVNQGGEDCDGTDDWSCPGQCQSNCRCP